MPLHIVRKTEAAKSKVIFSQFSSCWGRIVDPHLGLTVSLRRSRLLPDMHMWLCSAKNRSRLSLFYHFLFHFPLRFFLAARKGQKRGRIRNGRKILMSEMLFSNLSYLVLISLLSKDESILMKKNKNFPQKVAPYHLFLFQEWSGTISFGFSPFSAQFEKYLSLPSSKQNWSNFFSCNKDQCWWCN